MTKKLRGWVGVKDRRKTVALVTLTRSHAANHIILTLWYVPAAIGMVWYHAKIMSLSNTQIIL